MEPTLNEGDFVLVSASPQVPEPGQVVVATEPEQGRFVVKRVRSRGNRTIAVGSDNPTEGRDSRHFGSIDIDDVAGVVTLQFRPPSCLGGAVPRHRRRGS